MTMDIKNNNIDGDTNYKLGTLFDGKVQLEAKPYTIFKRPDDYEYHSGKLIAVNRDALCYVIKGNKIRVIGFKTENQLLKGHSGTITDLSIFPGGSLLASCDSSGAFIVWDLSTCSKIISVKPDETTTRSLKLVEWHPENRNIIAIGDDQQNVFIIQLNKIVEMKKQNINQTQAMKDQYDRIKTASIDSEELNELHRRIKYSLNITFDQIDFYDVIYAHDNINRIAFSSSGALLAIACENGSAEVLDYMQKEKNVFSAHTQTVQDVAFCAKEEESESEYFITCGLSEIFLWEYGEENYPVNKQKIILDLKNTDTISHGFHIMFDENKEFLFVAHTNQDYFSVFHFNSELKIFDFISEFYISFSEKTKLSKNTSRSIRSFVIEFPHDEYHGSKNNTMQLFCLHESVLQMYRITNQDLLNGYVDPLQRNNDDTDEVDTDDDKSSYDDNQDIELDDDENDETDDIDEVDTDELNKVKVQTPPQAEELIETPIKHEKRVVLKKSDPVINQEENNIPLPTVHTQMQIIQEMTPPLPDKIPKPVIEELITPKAELKNESQDNIEQTPITQVNKPTPVIPRKEAPSSPVIKNRVSYKKKKVISDDDIMVRFDRLLQGKLDKFHSDLEKKKEMSDEIIINNLIEHIDDKIVSMMEEKMETHITQTILPQLENSITNRVMPNLKKMYTPRNLQPVLTKTFQQEYEKKIIPAFNESCNNLFSQLHNTWVAGMQNFQTSLNSTQDFTQLIQSLVNTTNQMNENFIKSQKQMMKEHEAMLEKFLEMAATIKQSSGNNWSDNDQEEIVENTDISIKDEVTELFNNGDFQAAFHTILRSNDLELVEWSLSVVDLESLEGSSISLSQSVLMSLLQQISCTLDKSFTKTPDPNLKLPWLYYIIEEISPTTELVLENAETVLPYLVSQVEQLDGLEDKMTKFYAKSIVKKAEKILDFVVRSKSKKK